MTRTGHSRFFEFFFLVIYPAIRFRTRLLPITADTPSCCLFSSKFFEKYSLCLARSAVPIFLMYDGLIPMEKSCRCSSLNAAGRDKGMVCGGRIPAREPCPVHCGQAEDAPPAPWRAGSPASPQRPGPAGFSRTAVCSPGLWRPPLWTRTIPRSYGVYQRRPRASSISPVVKRWGWTHVLNGDVPRIENPKRDFRIRLVYRKFSMALIDREAFLRG